jgi:hypothetical protein
MTAFLVLRKSESSLYLELGEVNSGHAGHSRIFAGIV